MKLGPDFAEMLKNIGFSDKAGKVYLATLELGEAAVQEIAELSGVKRTSIYYQLEELMEASALFMTRRGKKTYYVAAPPKVILARGRERLSEFEDSLGNLELTMQPLHHKPRTHFLQGPEGFKHAWDMIFESKEKQYDIITDGSLFLDFVREKYILDGIIRKKKALGIKSRQLIVDSPYARKIIGKDTKENRESRLLSSRHKLPFTEIITEKFVAFISPRTDNTLFVIENDSFATTRRSLFEALWNKSPLTER